MGFFGWDNNLWLGEEAFPLANETEVKNCLLGLNAAFAGFYASFKHVTPFAYKRKT